MKKLKRKYLLMVTAFIFIVLQWMSIIIEMDLNSIKFSWFSLPTELSFWLFFLSGATAFVILAYYIGKDGEKAFKKKK